MVTGRKPRRGIALLATMLAVALMTLLVMDFTTTAALGYRSAANQADELRAYYLARSGVNVGLALLVQNALANPPQNQGGGGGTTQPKGHDSLDQIWAQPFPPIPVEGGAVSLAIIDEDRKINLNKLVDSQTGQPSKQVAEVIATLLANLNLSPDLLPTMIDWLDSDSIETPGGAEADFYLSLIPPYEPRNSALPTIYDLRMLKGMDDQTFLILSQFLTAMPTPKGVNLNTAPPEVLLALAPALKIDAVTIKDIINQRALVPFDQQTDVTRVIPEAGKPPVSNLLTTTSTYFTITGQGDFAGARKRVYATFKRAAAQGGGASFTLSNWHAD
ncbi:MAG TPA: type II secretion system minor pseudopilin GspK [Candidatus Binataceae bacterium]|nr:type II secretion system minor pseudopilin GspK [Candidatus Binataceae bacterium]